MNRRDLRSLLHSVRKTERGIMPDQAWQKAARAEILNHVKSSMPEGGVFSKRSLGSVFVEAVPKQIMQWTRRPAMAFLSIFGIMLGGSIASVSASERSLPGDFLYSVKLATEQTRFAFTGGSAEKLKLKAEFVGRRVDEIKTVATQPGERKQERIQEAAENLKRDLQTAKQQLTEVKAGASAKAAAEVAKLLDQKSTEVVAELKEVKDAIPAGAKPAVAEVESAAVNTGVKAVSVLIETRDNPETAEVISNDELKQSIEGKVQALETQIQETSERLRLSASSSTISASSTVSVPMSTTTAALASSTAPIVVANATLAEAKVLLQENKLELVPDKLLEVAKVTAEAELSLSSASGTTPLPETTTSTDPGAVSPTATTTEATSSSTRQTQASPP